MRKQTSALADSVAYRLLIRLVRCKRQVCPNGETRAEKQKHKPAAEFVRMADKLAVAAETATLNFFFFAFRHFKTKRVPLVGMVA